MNASIYAVKFVPSGFQIYAGKIFSMCFFLVGDGYLAVPNIHRGTHVFICDGSQAAMPYKNIRQENLAVSCTYIMKYYERYQTDLY